MENQPPNLGRGRGALLQQIANAKQSSQGPSTDSGLGHSITKSIPPPLAETAPPGNAAGSSLRQASGRGRLLQDLVNKISAEKAAVVGGQSTAPPKIAQRSGADRSLLIERMKALRIEQPQAVDEQLQAVDEQPKAAEVQPVSSEPNRRANQVVPEQEVVHKRGTKGTPLQITTNYIRLRTDANKGVFEYEVRYQPEIIAMNLRYKLLNQHSETVIGTTKTFDGTTLYLPIQLPDPITELVSTNQNDQTTVNLRVIFKRKKRLGECVQLYNVLFDRIMKQLNFVRFGRKLFDPTAPSLIPQHKLEVWPGYVTAVDEYEDGVMLCLDVSHRVLCQSTVLDMMRNAYRSDGANFQKTIMTALMGMVILTRYNNRTYRVDDVQFDASPMSTFDVNGRSVSYVEYYKSQYNLIITDVKQPLLVHREERTVMGKVEKEQITICLIPELCYLTGLTDTIRNDFRVMRDIASITRVTPNQRMAAYQQFCRSVNENADAKKVLSGWGLSIDKQQLQLQARQMDEEEVQFAHRSFRVGPQADFGKYATANELLCVVNLTNWLIIHTRNDTKCAKSFMEFMERNAKPMGVQVSKPMVEVLDADKTDLYVKTLRRVINAQLQIVVIICPTSRDDRYAAIKKVCCAELPIPSQVINGRTLGNEAKNRSIVQKIALQMNCKLGGTLWSVKIPFSNVMICGMDTYHDPTHKSDSVAAFVASQNSTFTKWFSQAIVQKKKEELCNGMIVALINSLNAYKSLNNKLPEKIIMYRDGVGDGQLRMCDEYEVPQMRAAFATVDPDYNPTLTFIVVQKRINTRIFAMKRSNEFENPLPGCVIDHTITRRFMYDFFLVPQSVRQGTVSPTHYIVVHDSANFSPDILQRLSFKLCFLYYNWPGTVRVPACCQYAHKLAFLVGQSVGRVPAACLSDKLYYL